jgi:hypothetical protein
MIKGIGTLLVTLAAVTFLGLVVTAMCDLQALVNAERYIMEITKFEQLQVRATVLVAWIYLYIPGMILMHYRR